MKETVIETAKDTGLELVSAGVGAMASRVGAAYIPGGAYGKMGIGLIAGIVAAKMKSKSGLGKHAKWAVIGASVVQFAEGLVEAAQPLVAKVTEGKSGALVDGLKKTVGLAAADTSFYEELLERNTIQPQSLAPAFSFETASTADPAGV